MNDEFVFPRIQEDMPIQGGPGLTARALFAAMAMQRLVLYRSQGGWEPSQETIANWSVAQSDALLAALAKEKL